MLSKKEFWQLIEKERERTANFLIFFKLQTIATVCVVAAEEAETAVAVVAAAVAAAAAFSRFCRYVLLELAKLFRRGGGTGRSSPASDLLQMLLMLADCGRLTLVDCCADIGCVFDAVCCIAAVGDGSRLVSTVLRFSAHRAIAGSCVATNTLPLVNSEEPNCVVDIEVGIEARFDPGVCCVVELACLGSECGSCGE